MFWLSVFGGPVWVKMFAATIRDSSCVCVVVHRKLELGGVLGRERFGCGAYHCSVLDFENDP